MMRTIRSALHWLRFALSATVIASGLMVAAIATAPPSAASTTVTFSYTGSAQSWTVPSGVTSIEADALGAQGGGTYGGLGAQVSATVPVTPGQVLQVYVGGQGGQSGGGFNGGGNGSAWDGSWGGGGASDLRTSSALTSRILVAAGGGGTGAGPSATRAGGGSGGPSTGQPGDPNCGVSGGAGGTQSAGGAGGTGGGTGLAGSLGNGGGVYHGGGGGGGGYYGGGGGADCGGSGSGGGGGSDYLESSATMVSEVSGYNARNGSMTITYGSGGSSGSPGSGTVNFSYTGAPQAWTVPAGVTSLQVDARGAQGGGPYGGLGSWIVATVPVAPGQVVEVMVGGTPSSTSLNSGGFDGGGNGSVWTYTSAGGGGASDVRLGGMTLENRAVVAAGGGGGAAAASANFGSGGSGGPLTGQAGDNGICSDTGGSGGTQSAGGAGGTGGGTGLAGSLGTGGGVYHGGGGGGGGYYGGGGGADCGSSGAGGGGGSDFVESAGTTNSETSGYNDGNGSVTIGYPTLSTTSGLGPPAATEFDYTGTPQTYAVPSGVTAITVDVEGAQGGNPYGGLGARVLATLPVVPGQVLDVFVGGNPATSSTSGGYDGGGNGSVYDNTGEGGGGASDIRVGGATLADRAVVAGGGGGGGGGASGTAGGGGAGGPSNGQAGVAGTCSDSGGGGGTQSAGGAGGTGANNGTSGSLENGGKTYHGGGGGAGGYYGGGGGSDCNFSGAGGGGGSDYLEPTGGAETQWSGFRDGNGVVLIATGGFTPNGGLISPQEEMANNAAEKFCAACHGDPINTETGGLAESFTDLSIPGPGPALSFGRSYNSVMASVEGPFGYGWTDSYNMSLSFGTGSPPSTVTVNQEDGTTVTFTYSGGAYTAPPRVMATLTDSGGTWTYTRQAKSIFTFNSSGQLTAESDLNGYTTTLSYSGSQLSTITDPEGRTLSLSYGTNGLVSEVADSSSPARTVSYGYDANGNLTDVIDIDAGHTQFSYNAAHDLLTYRKPRYYGDTTTTPTPVTTNVYNSGGQVTSQTDPMGRTTTFSYTEFSTTITDPKGDVIVEQYRNGVLISRTTGYGTSSAATTFYTYDPNTLGVTKTVYPDGASTSATYDAAGNVLTAVDALGHTTTYTYDSLDDMTSMTDRNGVTTTYTYDTDGNLLSKSTPLVGSSPAVSQTTTYTYASVAHPGLVTQMTDPDSQNWSYGYDTNGDLTSTTDPLGNETTATFNSIGEKLTQVSARGNVSGANPADFTTTYTYDNAGRILTVTDPLSDVTTTTYDADGNKASVTDGRSQTTSYTYDADEELTKVTNPDTTTETYAYDGDGNRLTYTDGNSHTTTYTYTDPAYPNAVTSSEDADSRTTTYTYNSLGLRATMVDPSSRTTTYSYDADQRLSGVSYSDGVTPNVTYSYDNDGNRTQMTDGTGTSTYSYDSLGRLTSTTDGGSNTVGYGYDLANNQTSITYPGTIGTVTYGYNGADQLTSVEDWNSNTTTYSYDADGNPTTETLPNGDTSSTTFDNNDQVTGISDAPTSTPLSPFATFSYTRDADTQVSIETDTGVPSPTSQTYAYDDMNQLTTSTPTSYTYDNGANLTTNTSGASQTFDAADQLSSSTIGSSTTNYTYNAEGQRTATTPPSGPSTGYSYNQAGDLTGISGSASATYTYNGDGLRVSKTVGTTATDQVWDTSGSVPHVFVDGSTYYVYGVGGLPLEQVRGSDTYYFLHDQLGSTRLLTDAPGNVAASYTYDPYGGVLGSTGTVTTPLRFAGAYTDAESGLIYLVNRYYDPATGQFLSVDPLVDVTQASYAYAGDDPVNNSDPAGLCVSTPFGCIGPGPANGISGTVGSILNGVSGAAKEGAHLTIDAVTDPAYLLYWGSFEGAAKLNKFGCSLGEAGCIGAHLLSLPFVPGEAVGLGVDAGGDWLKQQFLSNYPGVCDEGLPNQWLLGSQAGPAFNDWFGWDWKVTFPGIHPNGQIDFQW
jgi:RHS repeat-associated protein